MKAFNLISDTSRNKILGSGDIAHLLTLREISTMTFTLLENVDAVGSLNSNCPCLNVYVLRRNFLELLLSWKETNEIYV